MFENDPTIPREVFQPAKTLEDQVKVLAETLALQAEEARKKGRPRLIRAWEWFMDNNAWIAWVLALLITLVACGAVYKWRDAEARVTAATTAGANPALERAIGANAEKAKVVAKEGKTTAKGNLVYSNFEDADAAFKEAMSAAKGGSK